MLTDYILILDCHAICHSTRYAFGGLTWEERHTGVIFGFLDRLLTLSSKFMTNKFAFTWDSGKSFRKEIYPEYKKKRHEKERTEEERLIDQCAFQQFGELRTRVLPNLGFKNIFIQTGVEADDIIASIVINHQHPHFVVASDDNDLYQLLNHCDMWKLKSKVLYSGLDFEKEYKIPPFLWTEVKKLAGCSGDGVPGVSGIGTKRAIQYLKGQLTGKHLQNIYLSKSIIERNEKLVKLPFRGTTVPQLEFNKLSLDTVFQVCENYGMYSLLKGKRLETWKIFTS